MSIYSGKLYYSDADNDTLHLLCKFEEVEAENRYALMRLILDKEWDSRLDAAGCGPVFHFDEPATLFRPTKVFQTSDMPEEVADVAVEDTALDNGGASSLPSIRWVASRSTR